MNEFIQAHKTDMIYASIIIGVVIILYFSTRFLHQWLTKRVKEKLPGASLQPIHLIQRVLRLLWLVLGALAVSLVFIDSKEAILRGYFRLISYLCVVAVITIILIMLSNLWFRYKIKEEIINNGDPTNYKFLRYISVAVIGLAGVLFAVLAFPSLKVVAQTVLGGAGILALIAGFAAQEALANVTGGLFIIAFKPFKIGDRIKVTETMVGTVTDITLRHTIIKNFNNKMIVIPNAIINKEKIINYDLGEQKICEHIEVGISYDCDIDLAKKIIQEECERHPLILDNRSFKEKEDGVPIVRTALISLGDSSVNLRAFAWVSNHLDSFTLRFDVLESIKKRFDAEGIEIPYPHRSVVIKK